MLLPYAFLMTNTTLVITFVGPDRPGLVDAVSRIISREQGNWMASRLAHLGGQFAGMVQISLPSDRVEALQESLSELEKEGLTVLTKTDSEGAPTSSEAGTEATFEIIGQDRPGIVRAIARTLSQHQVNVEELTSERESAAMSGENLFRAKARVRIPGDCPIQKLQEDLESLAAELMVDLTLD